MEIGSGYVAAARDQPAHSFRKADQILPPLAL
jgi:hypothetical protein